MSNKKGFPTIDWSDSDEDFDFEKKEDHKEFSDLLAESRVEDISYRPGQQVEATLVGNPRRGESLAVDLGAQAAGIIDGMEFFSEEAAEPSHKSGDKVKMYVLGKTSDGYLLSLEKAKSLKSKEDMELAYRENIPVKGKVEKAVKGGFEVAIFGKRAFCPVSRLDTKYISEPASYVGHEYQFLITKLENGGRNFVVDRAKILERARDQALAELESGQFQDQKFSGRVARMEPYGVFVSMDNGLDGMVHISEISHIRLQHPSDTLKLGEQVSVVIKKLERDDRGQVKISLSIRDAGRDPWQDIENELETGRSYQGRVSRLESFGAFIELNGTYEGLLHVSEMSWVKKISHPGELVKPGDTVTVQIKSIDPIEKRISLSMKMPEDDPWLHTAPSLKEGQEFEASIVKLKDYGAIAQLDTGLDGLIPQTKLKLAFGQSFRKKSSPGQRLTVKLLRIDLESRRIIFTLPGLADEADSAEDYGEYVDSKKPELTAAKRGSFGDILAATLAKNK